MKFSPLEVLGSFCKKRQNPWNLVFGTFSSGKTDDALNALKESRDTFLDADAKEHGVLDYRRQDSPLRRRLDLLQDHHSSSAYSDSHLAQIIRQ